MSRRRAAFTLIELVVVIALLGVIGTGMTIMFAKSVDSYLAAVAEERLGTGAWITMERISRELRHATSVTAPLSGATATSVVFTRKPCGACQDSSTLVTFSYTKTDQKLWRITKDAGSRLMLDNVTSFSVTANTAPLTKRIYKIRLRLGAKTTTAENRTMTIETAIHPQAIQLDTWMEPVL